MDPALQEQIDQAVQPVLGEVQRQLAEAVRQQVEQALQRTRDEGADEAAQPVRQQVGGHVEQAPQEPRREGPPGRPERQSEAARQPSDDPDASSDAPGILQRAGAALTGLVRPGQQPDADQGERDASQSPLRGAAQATAAAVKETATRLVNALRELLQTVRGLLRTVVALLRLILVALRQGLLAALRPMGQGLGAVAGKVTGAVTS